jgi:hypothetical protein
MIAFEESTWLSGTFQSAAHMGPAASRNTDAKPYKSLFFNLMCRPAAALMPEHSRNKNRYANVADRFSRFLSSVPRLDEASRACGCNDVSPEKTMAIRLPGLVKYDPNSLQGTVARTGMSLPWNRALLYSS